jgi:hypothetical protein
MARKDAQRHDAVKGIVIEHQRTKFDGALLRAYVELNL